MLTKLSIENFKRLNQAEIELGRNVIFVGPNNSGKTSALQALMLWYAGLVAWTVKKGKNSRAKERTGATLNRRDLIALPVPSANLLWRNLGTRESITINGKQNTKNIHLKIIVEGIIEGSQWRIGIEFDYANPESIYCRPTDEVDDKHLELLENVLKNIHLVYLPPMSGLASVEPKVEAGRVNVLIGEGQTAQVLRNLCYSIVTNPEQGQRGWKNVVDSMRKLFGIQLNEPIFDPSRGEISMSYMTSNDKAAVELDISSSGRGMQQTLLLLAYLNANPNSTILLDEPDAHLEVLRQRQIYDLLCCAGAALNSQIILATHSEVVLNEAADKDTVIAFVGRPHRINDQVAQVKKALLSIGYDNYILAEQTGWVLYLEGSTDREILLTIARRLGHPASEILENAFVHYVSNNTPPSARDHFYGLREAKQNLVALAIFDRLERPMSLQENVDGLTEVMWKKKEIENYIITKSSLLNFAGLAGDLFSEVQRQIMEECISKLEAALSTTRKPSPWDGDLKVSEEFLEPLLEAYCEQSAIPIEAMRKKDFYRFAETLPLEELDSEFIDMLDLIVSVSKKVRD